MHNEQEETGKGLPESYFIGQELDWAANSQSVTLLVELPFWLMTANGSIDITVNGCSFKIDVRDNFVQVHAREMLDSLANLVYVGPDPSKMDNKIIKYAEENKILLFTRKCKTILRIHSQCNEDVLAAEQEEERHNAAILYLRAFCEAHLEIVNTMIRAYRVLTYDYFPFEVSPWDLPIWFVETPTGAVRVQLLDYAAWDHKPMIGQHEGPFEKYELISLTDFGQKVTTSAAAGELELLDAINLMERGNYSDAVRRITTAIEAMTEFALRQELSKHLSATEVKRKLKASRNNFPGRLQRYQTLSGRVLSEGLKKELEATRSIRHKIVHSAYRINAQERGRAQRSVDTGRWIFNWLENDAARQEVREKKIALRSLGRYFPFYYAEISAQGVKVHKPDFN